MNKCDLDFGQILQTYTDIEWRKVMLYQKNGQFIENISISMEDRAFMYGDGCFSTARWSAGGIVLWHRHLQRFKDAIIALKLNCTIQRLEAEAEHFIAQLKHYPYGTIKIVLSRGVSARGYALPETESDIYFYFYAAQVLDHQPTIIKNIGILSETLGTSMSCLRGIKTLNRLEQVMLKNVAQQHGWQEALCFDSKNNLVEAISSNCFVYLDGEWITSDLALAGIAGTMRQEILYRMQYYQIPYQIRMIAQAEIAHIEAAFLCNALQPMQIIAQLQSMKKDTQYSLQLSPCQHLFQAISLHQLV